MRPYCNFISVGGKLNNNSLSFLTVIHLRNSSKFYGIYSGTCFPLFIQERYPLGWQYSAFIFLGVNTLLLILIATLYTALMFNIWKTRRAAPVSTIKECEFVVRHVNYYYYYLYCFTTYLFEYKFRSS